MKTGCLKIFTNSWLFWFSLLPSCWGTWKSSQIIGLFFFFFFFFFAVWSDLFSVLHWNIVSILLLVTFVSLHWLFLCALFPWSSWLFAATAFDVPGFFLHSLTFSIAFSQILTCLSGRFCALWQSQDSLFQKFVGAFYGNLLVYFMEYYYVTSVFWAWLDLKSLLFFFSFFFLFLFVRVCVCVFQRCCCWFIICVRDKKKFQCVYHVYSQFFLLPPTPKSFIFLKCFYGC